MQFNITIVSVNRLFPTQLTTTAYGVCNFLAHSLACFSPFVAEIQNPYPFLVFNFLLVFAVLASFKLTEVKPIATLVGKSDITGDSEVELEIISELI